MTDHEYQVLLDLANSWQAAADQFEKEKKFHGECADRAQSNRDFVERDLHFSHAATAEIRQEVLAGAAKKLALKLGELRTSSKTIHTRKRVSA